MKDPLAHRWIPRLVLVLPFLVLPFALGPLVARVGDALGRAMVVLAPRPPVTHLEGPSESPGDPNRDWDADDQGEVSALPSRSAHAHPSSPSAHGLAGRARNVDAGAADASARGSIFVSAANVRRALPIAAKSARASSVVLPDGTRGVELRGVRGLRAGFEEGDVLVSAEGQPTPSPDTAVSIVTAALAAHRTALHGTLLRRGKPIDVTVEVPTE